MKISINEIIEKAESKEAVIFADSGIFTPEYDFFSRLYECQRYKQINPDTLIRLSKLANSTKKILESPKIKILPEAIEEFGNFKNKICEINSYFEQIENNKHKFDKNKKYKKYCVEDNYHKNLMDDFCLKLAEIKSCLNARTFNHPNENIHKETYKLLNHLEEKLQIKSDNSWREEFYNPKAEASKPRFNTDEKIVAAGIYTSLHKTKPAIIITGDGHLISLLNVYFNLLGNNDFARYYSKLDSILKTAPISLYYYDFDDNKCTHSVWINSLIKSDKEMSLYNKRIGEFIPEEETAEIRNLFYSNLENLLSNYKEPIIIQDKPQKENQENLEYAQSFQYQSPLSELIGNSLQVSNNSLHNQMY